MKEIVRSICFRHARALQFAGVLGPAVSLATFVVIDRHRRELGFWFPPHILLFWFAGAIALCVAGVVYSGEEPIFRDKRFDCIAILLLSCLSAMPIAAVILWCIGLFDPAVGSSYTLGR